MEASVGLFDELGGSLKGALGSAAAAAAPALISAVLAKTKFGDLSGLVNQLQQGGLDAQVKSWLGNGANLPVTADQIKAVLGNEQVKQIAEHFGIPTDAALKYLAEHLPTTVDQASPNGVVTNG
jgi:uncharacterized protein YidB (DUF937 family)